MDESDIFEAAVISAVEDQVFHIRVEAKTRGCQNWCWD